MAHIDADVLKDLAELLVQQEKDLYEERDIYETLKRALEQAGCWDETRDVMPEYT